MFIFRKYPFKKVYLSLRENGGIIDKPGKGRDYYHTCYGLSGLSVTQYFGDKVLNICQNDDSLLVIYLYDRKKSFCADSADSLFILEYDTSAF